MSMGQQNSGQGAISEGFFDLIKNADLYQARLKAIKEAEDSMKAAEASLDLGKEARLALNDASAMQAKARKTLSDANDKAKSVLEEAAEKAQGVIDYAEARAKSVDDDTNRAEQRLAELNVNIGEIEADIASQRDDAKKLQDAAAAEMDKALAVKTEYEEKRDKLKALL